MWHWSDILEDDGAVNWHSFLFLIMSCDTLDLKLNVKWKLSNIHKICWRNMLLGLPMANESVERPILRFAFICSGLGVNWLRVKACLMFETFASNTLAEYMEVKRGNYCIWAYLLVIQHKNLTPSRFVTDSSQTTRLTHVSITNSSVKLFKNSNLRAAYYFWAFMLDEGEESLYAILPSVPWKWLQNKTPFLLKLKGISKWSYFNSHYQAPWWKWNSAKILQYPYDRHA